MSQAEMKGQKSLIPFVLFPIEMALCNYENLLVLGASFFESVRKERMLFKYHIKICSKNKHKQKSNSLKVMNRNIFNRPQVYEISV